MRFRSIVVIVLALLWAFPAQAQDDIGSNTEREIKALVRSLDYVRGLSDDRNVRVAIIYNPANTHSVSEANIAENIFRSQLRMGKRQLTSVQKISIDHLLSVAGKVDVLYISGWMSEYFPAVYRFAADHHIFTMSADGNCVYDQCCILSAVSGETLQIYLNPVTMKAIGFDFDAAFKFIAKQVTG